MRQVFRVAWYRFRATFASRWGGYASVVVLVGLVGGLAMGSVAGARRTDSSFPIYLASTNPSSIMVITGFDDPGLGQKTGYDVRAIDAIAHLPLVEHSATSVGFDGNIDLGAVTGTHPHIGAGETPPTVIGGEEYLTMDRVTLIEGRLANPRRKDEAIMDAQAAKEMGPPRRIGHRYPLLHRRRVDLRLLQRPTLFGGHGQIGRRGGVQQHGRRR